MNFADESSLPLLIVMLPLVGALTVLALMPFRSLLVKRLSYYMGALFVGLTLILTIFSFVFLLKTDGSIVYRFSYLLIVQLSLNPLSFTLIILTLFIWAVVSFYATSYMNKDRIYEHHIFLAIALSALLGVFLAANFFTLFIFFDILGYAVYVLVVNNRTKEALKAGTKYLIMAILGDSTLLVGIFLFYHFTGGTSFAPEVVISNDARLLVFVLMGLGFATKASLIPLHIWLPDAHPVAPCPASALLSGLVIKAGAYGLIRSYLAIFSFSEGLEFLGSGIIWFGIISMFFGILMALLQKNIKKMLAYHSISQMGYIVLGLGCAAYLGKAGGEALGASLFHLINHALFKASLFLGAGAIYFSTGELDMYKLGGLVKKMPLTAISLIIAACGISGVPLFNGYISKTLLHHSLTSIEGYYFFETIFVLTSAATFASFLKLISLSLFGKIPERANISQAKEVSTLMSVPNLLLSAAIILIGLFPNLVWQGLLLPSLKQLGYFIETSPISILSVSNLSSFLITSFLGVMIFFLGLKYHLFEVTIPEWLSINYWAERLAFNLYFILRRGRIFEGARLTSKLKYSIETVEIYKEELGVVSEFVKSLMLTLEKIGVEIYYSTKDTYYSLVLFCRELVQTGFSRYHFTKDTYYSLVLFCRELVQTGFSRYPLAVLSASASDVKAKDYREDLSLSVLIILLSLLVFLLTS